MAHMWFGDLVTMEWWDGLWLNESFATFMAALAVAECTRFGDVSWVNFCAGMKFWGYAEDQLPTTHAISSAVADTDGGWSHPHRECVRAGVCRGREGLPIHPYTLPNLCFRRHSYVRQLRWCHL